MIRSLTQNDIKEAADLLFTASLTPHSASYPLYKTRSDAEREIALRLSDKTPIVLGLYDGDHTLSGLLTAFTDGDYLETTAFTAVHAKGYDEFTAYLLKNYSYCDINVGLEAENEHGCRALECAGFNMAEASYDMRLARSAFRSDRSQAVISRICDDNFSEYARFHDAHFQDVYWNSERLKNHLGDWHVFAGYDRGVIRAGLFMTVYGENGESAEIYGISAEKEHDELLLPLLSQSINALFFAHPNVQNVMFMIEEEAPETARLLPAAKRTGFTLCGRYRLYQRS